MPTTKMSLSLAEEIRAPTVLGTAIRQGCKSLVNLEIVPQPPADRAADQSMAAMAADFPNRLWPRGGGSEIWKRPTTVFG